MNEFKKSLKKNELNSCFNPKKCINSSISNKKIFQIRYTQTY